jgi:hypothetical protein
MGMPSDVVSQLEAMPDLLERCFRLVPPEFARWLPESWDGAPGEKFSALGQICHVRDIETDGYRVRFRRTLEEEVPFLPSVDGDRLAVERGYDAASGAQVLAQFREARAQTVAMLRAVQPAQAERRAVFEGYGEVTLTGLAHYLCSHDQQHLACLHWLLGKIRSLS